MREWLGLRTAVIMKVEGGGNKCDDADDKRDAAAAAAAAEKMLSTKMMIDMSESEAPAVVVAQGCAVHSASNTSSAHRQRHDSHEVKSMTMGRPLVELQRYYKPELVVALWPRF